VQVPPFMTGRRHAQYRTDGHHEPSASGRSNGCTYKGERQKQSVTLVRGDEFSARMSTGSAATPSVRTKQMVDWDTNSKHVWQRVGTVIRCYFWMHQIVERSSSSATEFFGRRRRRRRRRRSRTTGTMFSRMWPRTV
jgi:hypothetical protein